MRFGLVEDYANVINGGLWFIEGHFLTVRAWEPNFKPANAVCNMVAVWVRLPKLPFEYYDPSMLKEIGNAIGPVLRVDSNAASEARGCFARICIQFNLDKPLISSILLKGVIQEVLYEGISTLCFSCGHVGHRQEGCPFIIKERTPSTVVEGTSSSTDHVETNGEVGDYSQEAGKVESKLKGDRKEVYGPCFLLRGRKQ